MSPKQDVIRPVNLYGRKGKESQRPLAKLGSLLPIPSGKGKGRRNWME